VRTWWHYTWDVFHAPCGCRVEAERRIGVLIRMTFLACSTHPASSSLTLSLLRVARG